MGRCAECGVSRRDGWLLVDGLCADCGPESHERRRDVLRDQARELLGDATQRARTARKVEAGR